MNRIWKFRDVLIYAFRAEINRQLGLNLKIEDLTCEQVKDHWEYTRNEERRCVYDVYTISPLDPLRIRIYIHPGNATIIGNFRPAYDNFPKGYEINQFYHVDGKLNLKLYILNNNTVRHDCPKVIDEIIVDDELMVMLQELGDPILDETFGFVLLE